MDGSTPRPWIAVGNWVEHPNDKIADICSCDPATIDQEHMGRSDAEIRANARRIVAAVNATSDLPIEALEADVVRKLVEAGQALLDNLADGEFVSLTRLDAFRAANTLAKGEAA